MIEVCERAIDRVRTLEDKERHLSLCFKYLVCPECGEDIEKTFVGDREIIPTGYLYLYECKDCGWKKYRTV
jgi:hypothetical protein